MTIQFSPKGHKYHVGKREVPSVTHIVGDKLDDFLFNGAGMDMIRKAGEFGTVVHELCHFYNTNGHLPKEGEKIHDPENKVITVDAEMLRFAKGWVNLLEHRNWIPYKSEIVVGSTRRKFAGRLDNLIKDKSRLIHLVDLKVRTSIPASVALQTAGYKLAYEEMFREKISYRWCAQLTGVKEGYKLYPLKGLMDEYVFTCKLISLQWDISNAGKNL